MTRFLLAAPLILLAACRQEPEPPSAPASTGAAPSPVPNAAAESEVPAIPGLHFGQPVAATSGWTREGAQASDDCLVYTARSEPNAYAIVIGNRLERVSYATGSAFRLPTGIGLGSDENAVRHAYPDFVHEPHKYEEAPAGYLTQPNLAPGQPGLRFEIGPDRKVEVIHIGLPSSLSLVEGCA